MRQKFGFSSLTTANICHEHNLNHTILEVMSKRLNVKSLNNLAIQTTTSAQPVQVK